MRMRAISSERNRLAREMHDTLLQGTIGISTLLEACSSPYTREEDRSQLMDCARQQVAELIGQTRDAMWNLRGHEYEQCDFGLCVQKLLDQHVKPSGMMTRYSYHGVPLELDYRIAYELLMSIREALLNAVAHSAASELDVTLTLRETELSVEIRDNGHGFDLAACSNQPSGHYGIRGMQERVQNAGGHIEIETAQGRGTCVKILAPRAALEHAPSRLLEL